MRNLAPPPEPPALTTPAAQAEIVIPVTSQQRVLALSVLRLHSFLTGPVPFTTQVTIAASRGDRSWATAQALAATFPEVSAVHVGAPGRGAALRRVWPASQCEVLAYLDTDLSVDLEALIPLIEPLLAGHADMAIGTRLVPGALPQHRPRREITSCGYSLLVQAGMGTGFADAQCGFKAITRARAAELLPQTSKDGWFLDSELLRLAESAGLRIREVPVNRYRQDTRHTRRHRPDGWRAIRRGTYRFGGNAA
jgi:hypothetical protein